MAKFFQSGMVAALLLSTASLFSGAADAGTIYHFNSDFANKGETPSEKFQVSFLSQTVTRDSAGNVLTSSLADTSIIQAYAYVGAGNPFGSPITGSSLPMNGPVYVKYGAGPLDTVAVAQTKKGSNMTVQFNTDNVANAIPINSFVHPLIDYCTEGNEITVPFQGSGFFTATGSLVFPPTGSYIIRNGSTGGSCSVPTVNQPDSNLVLKVETLNSDGSADQVDFILVEDTTLLDIFNPEEATENLNLRVRFQLANEVIPTELLTEDNTALLAAFSDPIVLSLAPGQSSRVGVPEPLTILGISTAISFGAAFKRKLNKKQNKG